MAIKDLLWACPECGEEAALEPQGRAEACRACGTVYRRGRGATIVAQPPGAPPVARPAAEWVDRLPELRLDAYDGDGVRRRDPVEVRFAGGADPVRHQGEFLGRVERLGPPRPGVLALTRDGLVLQQEDGTERRWPLGQVTAVQASSSTLQLNLRGEPVVSFRFRDGSLQLWELLLMEAIRRWYREAGKGEVVEFQPRIVTR